MKKNTVLRVLLFTMMGYLSVGTVYCANVTMTYTYSNDVNSRAAGLVPAIVHTFIDNKPTTVFPLSNFEDNESYSCQLSTSLYSTEPTLSISVERIIDIVIDKFDLNEFVKLGLYMNDKEVTDLEILKSELIKTPLIITYRLEDNTPEQIQKRRIDWVIEKITGVSSSSKWERGSFKKHALIRAALVNDYCDELGNPRSIRKLEEIGRSALTR